MKQGQKITTLEQLEKMALDKKSLIQLAPFDTPIPAAVVINMSAITVLRKIRSGLFVYNAPPKNNPFTKK